MATTLKEIYNVKDHTVGQTLEEAHENIVTKVRSSRLLKGLDNDIKRAKIMEQYLRDFKGMSNATQIPNNAIANRLQDEIYKDIANRVDKALGLKSGSLFNRTHGRFYDQAKSLGADDIFEIELKQFLEEAVRTAIGNNGDQALSTLKVIGSDTGYLKLHSYAEKAVKQSLQGFANKNVKNIGLRAIKADVNSFSSDYEITADLDPYWKDFLKVFANARFTVKNYNGKSLQTEIHLGDTDLRKAIISPLKYYGRFNDKAAIHIFDHAISVITNKTHEKDSEKVGDHLLHLRFAYELAGEGLVDEQGNEISGADFFIYNDPTSNNIFVRSTKQMIKEYLDEQTYQRKQDPLGSKIVISKSAFA